MFKAPYNLLLTVPRRFFRLACVYLLYASSAATFMADRFASFCVLCNENKKYVKYILNVLCWSVEFVLIVRVEFVLIVQVEL